MPTRSQLYWVSEFLLQFKRSNVLEECAYPDVYFLKRNWGFYGIQYVSYLKTKPGFLIKIVRIQYIARFLWNSIPCLFEVSNLKHKNCILWNRLKYTMFLHGLQIRKRKKRSLGLELPKNESIRLKTCKSGHGKLVYKE